MWNGNLISYDFRPRDINVHSTGFASHELVRWCCGAVTLYVRRAQRLFDRLCARAMVLRGRYPIREAGPTVICQPWARAMVLRGRYPTRGGFNGYLPGYALLRWCCGAVILREAVQTVISQACVYEWMFSFLKCPRYVIEYSFWYIILSFITWYLY